MNSPTDDKDDKQDMRILNELENIDDELEKEGIVIVRIDNAAEAKEYGLDHLPALIYFENKIPALYEGDLMNEDEVLEWLLVQKKTATIEEVTDEILVNLINEHEYVVVFFTGPCEPGETCDHTLNALESIPCPSPIPPAIEFVSIRGCRQTALLIAFAYSNTSTWRTRAGNAWLWADL